MSETEISTLGEFGLIESLTKNFEIKNASTQYGVGDDCAVLNYSSDAKMRTLVTTDVLLEGIHFDLTYTPLKHLGYKSAVVNFSDVYAMNGTPKQITVSLGISKRFTVEHISELYAGIRLACEQYGVDLVGGDTSASVTGLIISITCIGEGEEGKIVYRNGAKDTDLICVSGDLGAAYMGLQLLEREREVGAGQKDFQPDFSGREYILERQLKPEARRDVIAELKELGIQPTAMMDVSDGLSSELLHICKDSNVGCRIYEDRIPIDYQTAVMAEELNMNLVTAAMMDVSDGLSSELLHICKDSNVGCRIYEDRIPIDYQTAVMAEELNMNLVTAAMNGGEDYELLFTVPLTDHEKVAQMKTAKLIGRITKPELGAFMTTRDEAEIAIRAQGWNAFTEEETEE